MHPDHITDLSFDISKDQDFVVKLSQKGLHSYKISDNTVQSDGTHFLRFERPLHLKKGLSDNVLKSSIYSSYIAYTNKSQVICTRFAQERGGFGTDTISLPHMSNVNSIDWAYDQNHLLTGSQDDFAMIWDIETENDLYRIKGGSVDSKISLVAMCKGNFNIFATCHYRDIKIWDKRNTVSSFSSYAGHGKIMSFDWSPHKENEFITCSLDKTIKLWDMKQTRIPVKERKMSQQVWRVLHDPNCYRNISNVFIAVTVPEEHEVTPQVLEFDTETPLSTLSRTEDLVLEARVMSDQTLNRTTLLGLCKSGKFYKWVLDSYAGNKISAPRTVIMSPEPQDVAPSFPEMPDLSSSPNSSFIPTPELLRFAKSPFVHTLGNQQFLIKLHKSNFRIKMDLSSGESPSFQIEDLPANFGHEKEESCIRDLIAKSKELKAANGPETWPDKLVSYIKDEFIDIHFPDEDQQQQLRKTKITDFEQNVPFARTSGARFCSNNLLIVFHRVTTTEATPEVKPIKTPKKLTEASQILPIAFPRQKRGQSTAFPLVSEYYYPLVTRNRQTRGHTENQSNLAGSVEIKDMSRILPANCEKLAAQYTLDDAKGVEEICNHNLKVASKLERPDLVQLWKVLRLTTQISLVKHLQLKQSWIDYPYGRKLIEMFVNFYFLKKDVQSLAMIYSVCSIVDRKLKEAQKNDSISDGATIFTFLKDGDMLFPQSSTSVSIAECGYPGEESDSTTPHSHPGDTDNSLTTVDSFTGINGEYIKMSYASILYNWSLLNRRAEVLKTVKFPRIRRPIEHEYHIDIYQKTPKSTHNYLSTTPKLYHEPQHHDSGAKVWNCAICRLPVRSLGSFCLRCFHGGHDDHIQQWFTTTMDGAPVEVCPTGCGCRCVSYMGVWANN